jgi:hypothetical protein
MLSLPTFQAGVVDESQTVQMGICAAYPTFLVLGSWLLIALILGGLGALVFRVGRTSVATVDEVFLCFWSGWSLLIVILEIWHLAWPIGTWTFIVVAGIGIAGLASIRKTDLKCTRDACFKHLPASLLFAALALLLANLALHSARHGDTGAYFLPTIVWLRSFPIVPGLGNLSVTYGFNHAYFLYAAYLDAGPLLGRAHHLANGLLILAVAARSLLGASHVLRWREACRPVDVYYAILLFPLSRLGTGIFLTSPSPDLAVFMLGLVLTGELLRFLSEERGTNKVFHLFALTLLGVAGVSVKQSLAGLASITLSLAWVVWLWRVRQQWRRSARVVVCAILFAVVLFVPWMIRSIVLTGFPFYPSSLAGFPVKWRVNVDWQSWTQGAMTLDLRMAFSSPRAFSTQLDSFGWYDTDVGLPLAIGLVAALVGLAAFVIRRLRRISRAQNSAHFLILIPTVGSFLFCLVLAPMARYFGSVFWLLAAESGLLALGGCICESGRRRRIAVGLACVVAACIPMYQARFELRCLSSFESLPHVTTKEVRLQSGLSVQIPESGCSCWSAPQPCTPTPNVALKLRRDGDVASGFMLDPNVRSRRHPDADPRCQMGIPPQ